jgi:hypothetical protein
LRSPLALLRGELIDPAIKVTGWGAHAPEADAEHAAHLI